MHKMQKILNTNSCSNPI